MEVARSPCGHAGAVDSPRQKSQLSDLFFESTFDRLLDVFWFPFEVHLWWFSVFVTSFIRAWVLKWFLIDCGMICCLIFDVYLIPFPFAYATCETFKTIVLHWTLMFLPFRKTWILITLMIFPVTNLGIYFWWVWASIWGDRFWDRFWIWFVDKCW